jgi:hypothetical protein
VRYSTAAAFRRALEERLKTRVDGDPARIGRDRKRVVFDRLLTRLALAAPGTWVLKDGFALDLRLGEAARTTRDGDVAWRVGEEQVLDVLVEAAAGVAEVRPRTLVQSWDDPGGPYLDLDSNPNEQAVVYGQVLSGMDPSVRQATVTVYNAVTGVAIASAAADFAGYYWIEHLPAGDIKIGATAPNFLPGYANNKDTLATANVFHLANGEELGQSWDPSSFGPYLDLNDDPAAGPEGVIAGQVVSGTTPVPARVTLYDASGSSIFAQQTKADGSFRLRWLPAGEYKVNASAAGYQEGWANDQSSWEAGNLFVVEVGKTLVAHFDLVRSTGS